MSGFMQDWLKLFDGYELAGREQSFKLSYQSILLERTLVGIPSKNLSTADLAHICRKLSMPEDLYAQFLKERDGANQILFGFEENPTGIVYKTYLEYWDRLVTEIRSRPEVVSPKLLHLGFKWDPSAPDGSTVARYVCHPLLPVMGIFDRLHKLYQGAMDTPSCTIARDLLFQANKKIRNDSFIYLEVEEGGNPRRSFDLNFYKADLSVADIGSLVLKAVDLYSLPESSVSAHLESIGDRPFGHLAGGSDRKEQDFLTFYYEV